MKRFYLFIVFAIIMARGFSQAPQSFSYQAVVRDSTGTVLSNQNVSIKISIELEGSYNVPVYIESHDAVSNSFGMITIKIGEGTPILGSFEEIDWGQGTYFLKIEMDVTGDSNYQLMGESQLLTVPYAMQANSLVLTDENGNKYEISVDTAGNVTTNKINEFTNCGDVLADNRDGQTYNTVQVGNQCWMLENLNVGDRMNSNYAQTDNNVLEKYCYDDNENNCDTYGGLYQWGEMMQYISDTAAQGICPQGWRLPTDNDWIALEGLIDSQVGPGDPQWNQLGWRGNDAGGNLKETGTSHWQSPNTGATNSSGFTAIPSGCYNSSSGFQELNTGAIFWSTTESGNSNSISRKLAYDHADIGRNSMNKNDAYSVRCVKNSYYENNPPQLTYIAPPNGITEWYIDTQLTWNADDPENDPLTYDVYFGTDNPPPLVSSNQTQKYYLLGTLIGFTTYYWKIVAHDYLNETIGDIWNFTTENLPPDPPSNPLPANGATNQDLNITLSWSCYNPDPSLLTYNVYFGETNPPVLVSYNQTDTTYIPDELSLSTTYYWKIVVIDNGGGSTSSDIWSFTTYDCSTPLVDARDGQSYNVIQIGDQCWMAENLNIGTRISGSSNQVNNSSIEKYCYNDDENFCNTYGGLYQWDEMMQYSTDTLNQGICPDGWRLPTDNDWKILEGNADTQYGVGDPEWDLTNWRGSDAAGNLKETGNSHWNIPNTGATNSTGFTTLPSGWRQNTGSTFDALHYGTMIWTSSQYDVASAWVRNIYYDNAQIGRSSQAKLRGNSVRCLKN